MQAILLALSLIFAVANLQVFDAAKEKVVQTIPVTPDVRQEAEAWLNSVESLSPQFNIDIKQGLVLKVPFDPPYNMKSRFYTGPVSEVNLILPPDRRPTLLVITKENRPLVFLFTRDVKPFLKRKGIQ